jgi:hypothetical protein
MRPQQQKRPRQGRRTTHARPGGGDSIGMLAQNTRSILRRSLSWARGPPSQPLVCASPATRTSSPTAATSCSGAATRASKTAVNQSYPTRPAPAEARSKCSQYWTPRTPCHRLTDPRPPADKTLPEERDPGETSIRHGTTETRRQASTTNRQNPFVEGPHCQHQRHEGPTQPEEPRYYNG